jgi:hypothetical protein
LAAGAAAAFTAGALAGAALACAGLLAVEETVADEASSGAGEDDFASRSCRSRSVRALAQLSRSPVRRFVSDFSLSRSLRMLSRSPRTCASSSRRRPHKNQPSNKPTIKAKIT